jgi:hypothetical protein
LVLGTSASVRTREERWQWHACILAFGLSHNGTKAVMTRTREKTEEKQSTFSWAHFSTHLHSVKLNTFGQSAKLNNTIQGEKLKMVAAARL